MGAMTEINNLTTVEIEESFVKEIINKVLLGEGADKEADISVAFLGPGRMRKLNKQYRKANRVTDVLSFPEIEVPFEKYKIGRPKKHKGLGEIVICLREVKKNARQDNTEFVLELEKVLIHGVLHILGYDHEKTEEKANAMKKAEVKYLS